MKNITTKIKIVVKLYSVLIIAVFTSAMLNGCTSQQAIGTRSPDNTTRRLLLRDEGLSQLSYIDISNPKSNWFVPVPAGRDIQLVGNGRVLIGTGNGYEEREIATGNKVYELTSFAGTVTARRLRNGNTLLAGVNWQKKQGIVLVEVDKTGRSLRLIAFPGFTYVRLVRETVSGTFLVTADEIVFEGNAKGEIVWQATVTGLPKPHAWQALRLGNGQTVVSSGYAKNFQIFTVDGKLADSITGPASVNPTFYAGFQILANGNYVVTNWQGHGPAFGASGTQLLEYTPKGELVWSWKQDPAKFSSLQGVIVLNDLDVSRLHVEDGNGRLAPVKGVR
ncbi:MAG: hypothetical protein WKF97_13300 [Chitinophagaceae bacterium]